MFVNQMMVKRDHHSSPYPGSPKIRQAMISADKCLSSENYILHFTPILVDTRPGVDKVKPKV